MLGRLRGQRIPLAAGAAAIAAFLAADLLLPASRREDLRETAFDLVLASDRWLRPPASHPPGARIVVVDIDRRSLEAIGPWPWPRATMAALVDAIAAAKPALAAIDVLFAEQELRCVGTTARGRDGPGGRCEPAAPGARATEGDSLLAQSAQRIPLVVGFVLDPESSGTLRQAPIVTRGSPSLPALWAAAGAIAPPTPLSERAAGIGALSLPATDDAVVRNVPLLVGIGGHVMPGFAIETVRVARNASAYLLQAAPPLLATADIKVPLRPDAFLRLFPVTPERRAVRVISALDLFERKADPAKLAGAIVLVGGSAPELGGLRVTVTDPLTPSVQIQADAIEQIDAGRFPRPLDAARTSQLLLVLVLAIGALAAGAALPPVIGALAVVAMIGLTWIGAIAVLLVTDRLVDPLTPSLGAAQVFAVTAVAAFAVTHRREARVRRLFEQRLAPAVVRRIVEEPGLVKLGGERREVTSLFTDVEGFTAMTHRAGPGQLVAVLDAYFEGITALIVEHGGMVDKMVGDAVHALFNAPLDLPDHPRRAMECAIVIRSWTEAYRALPAPTAIGFGRTRIGIETGEVIVGDVGAQAKLDYTAHGDAVNAAARLEAANKELGSSICIGPAAAARCPAEMLRPLGTIVVRGRDETMAVFEPWPLDTSPAWRERYSVAFALREREGARAAALFDELAAEFKQDPVARRMADRLRAAGEERKPD
jgi:adenylate cyclase